MINCFECLILDGYMLKVLINGLQLSNSNSGVQYYTQQLYKELEKNESDEIKLVLLQFSNGQSGINNRIKRIILENFYFLYLLRKSNFNLYHSPNYVLPFFINSPSVLTIHDLITLDYPELCQNESVLYFKHLLPLSIAKATKIIAVSNTVKNDILKHFNIPPSKIEVIFHGINPIFKFTINKSVYSKYQLPEKYILFVGNIEPKKNIERLILAFELLKKNKEINHKLVIVGKKGWKYRHIFNTISNLAFENEIILTGYVSEDDLPAIYSQADLFAFPSLYEGFGIPPLEAMACETPVLVSNKGALPEITGNTCLQVDPYNIQAISKGMYLLLTNNDLREKQVSKGKEWIKRFSWEKAAIETIEVYKQALNYYETSITENIKK